MFVKPSMSVCGPGRDGRDGGFNLNSASAGFETSLNLLKYLLDLLQYHLCESLRGQGA